MYRLPKGGRDVKKKIAKKIALTGLATVVLLLGLNHYFRQNIIKDEVFAADEKDDTSLQVSMDDYFSDENYNGIAMVLENGDVLSASAYGYSNYEAREKNTLDTLFPVASLQKMMTATLVAKEISQGKISYETPLSDFYPDIAYSDEITIRDLLDQTSGIRMDEIAPGDILKTQKEQMDYVLESLESTGEMSFSYTNANYSLLAGILSTVTGEDYETLFTKEIIEPLHLSNTFFWDTVSDKKVAKAYNSSILLGEYATGTDNFVAAKPLYSSLIGAGNVLMSAKDLATYLEGLTNGTLITKDEFSDLIQGNPEYSGAFWGNDELLQTNGSLGNYQSSVLLDKSGGKMVILISNGSEIDSLSDLASDIYQRTFN